MRVDSLKHTHEKNIKDLEAKFEEDKKVRMVGHFLSAQLSHSWAGSGGCRCIRGGLGPVTINNVSY